MIFYKKNRAMNIHTTRKAIVGIGLLLCLQITSLAQSASRGKEPQVTLSGVKGSKATSQQILANPRLIDENAIGVVTKFNISFQTKDGNIIGPFRVKGAVLTNNETDVIKRLSGRPYKIIAEDIMVKCKDDNPRPVNNLVIDCNS